MEVTPPHIHKPLVVVLLGPTAVGKTAVALVLAQRFGAEIVNADSLAVYREFNIGTAKPTVAERAQVPHHLLDLVDPPEAYDAARYLKDGREVLSRLHDKGVPPLVVGGTGLYLKALLYGLFPEGSPRTEIRTRLHRELADHGLGELYQRLTSLDPVTATRLHPRDTYRILRALEVMEAVGRPLAEMFSAHRFRESPYRVLKLGLRREREELNRRIEARLDAMLAQGWVAEVEELLGRYPPHLKPLQALGYRHLTAYLTDRWGWEETLALIVRDTRRYAKRQLTWFRADPEVRWFHPEDLADLEAELAEALG